jgi:hypothetical protein
MFHEKILPQMIWYKNDTPSKYTSENFAVLNKIDNFVKNHYLRWYDDKLVKTQISDG